MPMVAESTNYIQVFCDGTVKRFAPPIVSASTSSEKSFSNGYKFKDVIIDPSKPITARLFLPDTNGNSCSLLPVFVYFHGGGFCIGSTTWLGYHQFLGEFSFASQSVVLSIDYRLAPENRLPIAYEDCYASLEWLNQQADTEPWLKRADFSRVFLSGDSAGGNIAHNVALRAMRTKGWGIEVRGLMLIHPYFGSEKRTAKEMEDGAKKDVSSNDMFWKLSIPEGLDRDYFGCNYEMQNVKAGEWRKFPAVVVYVAELDFLKERGVIYAEFLARKGVKEVMVVETKEESHVFHVFNPVSDPTRLLQEQMSKFMERH